MKNLIVTHNYSHNEQVYFSVFLNVDTITYFYLHRKDNSKVYFNNQFFGYIIMVYLFLLFPWTVISKNLRKNLNSVTTGAPTAISGCMQNQLLQEKIVSTGNKKTLLSF